MRIPLRTLLLLAAFAAAAATQAQQAQQHSTAPSRFEAAMTYDAAGANLTKGNSFWMQGGAAEVCGAIGHNFSAVAQFTELHTGSVSAAQLPLSLVAMVFGPRYTWQMPHSSRRNLSIFGQALAGDGHGFDSLFPSGNSVSSSASSVAFELGGGVNLGVSHHLALRLIQANWLRTQLPNGGTNVQNSVLLGAGLAYRF